MIPTLERLKRLKNKRELQEAYKRLFTTGDGELILEDLRMQCYWYHYTNGPRDEGKNDVIKYIHDHINPLNEELYDEPLEESPNGDQTY